MSFEPQKWTARWVDHDEWESQFLDPVVREIGGMGGDPDAPTWDQYLAARPTYAPALIAIRDACLRDQLDLYGDDMNDGGFIVYCDGVPTYSFSPTWRGWGDFRQAYENRREGYMTYYTRR